MILSIDACIEASLQCTCPLMCVRECVYVCMCVLFLYFMRGDSHDARVYKYSY